MGLGDVASGLGGIDSLFKGATSAIGQVLGTSIYDRGLQRTFSGGRGGLGDWGDQVWDLNQQQEEIRSNDRTAYRETQNPFLVAPGAPRDTEYTGPQLGTSMEDAYAGKGPGNAFGNSATTAALNTLAQVFDDKTAAVGSIDEGIDAFKDYTARGVASFMSSASVELDSYKDQLQTQVAAGLPPATASKMHRAATQQTINAARGAAADLTVKAGTQFSNLFATKAGIQTKFGEITAMAGADVTRAFQDDRTHFTDQRWMTQAEDLRLNRDAHVMMLDLYARRLDGDLSLAQLWTGTAVSIGEMRMDVPNLVAQARGTEGSA